MQTKFKNILTVCATAAFLFGFSLWSILKPDLAVSTMERRPLVQFPTPTVHTIRNGSFMSDFENYTLDQFPLRDQFRTVQTAPSFFVFRQKDSNDISIQQGYASKLEYPIHEDSISYACSRFRYLYNTYMADKNVNIYLSIVPDKNYFLAKSNGYPSIDYETFIKKVQEQMDYASYIDILPLLELSDYYRTDSHWRQEKLFDVAHLLASKMGVTLSAHYTPIKIEQPFYGVYQSVLPLKPDELYYLEQDFLTNCRMYDYESETFLPIYDLDKANSADPYELFLSGSKSLLRIENPAATSSKELIVFRDSFGSSLIPLLIEGYSKITAVDIRYVSPHVLGNFIEFNNQDILFLYNTSVLNNSITLK